MLEIFKNGSCWTSFDFHLHTKADKEFTYKCPDEENDTIGNFAKKYVDRLIESDIQGGVITNHNKFDLEEYKAISKRALKSDITIHPGVELSVGDGANGIHVLVVFSDKWIYNKHQSNYIEIFLNEVFGDTPNRENENTTCKCNFEKILEYLHASQSKGRDSFIILAHVEDRCGFFRELQGGRVRKIIQNPYFQDFVLGLQKVRTIDEVEKWKDHFKSQKRKLPAFVEGSDPKSLKKIGVPHQQTINGIKKSKRTYLKLGDSSFNSLKISLIHHHIRVSEDSHPNDEHSSVSSISFIGGKLDGKKLYLNSNLNCLIGLPGAGKSSVIETIRYVLGKKLEVQESGTKSRKVPNFDYKSGLVEHFIGSGGEVSIEVISKLGTTYRIVRTLNDAIAVYNSNGDKIDVQVDDIFRVMYFGQKDLTFNNQKGFNFSFIRKFVEKEVKEFEDKIDVQNSLIVETLAKLRELNKLKDSKKEIEIKLHVCKEQLRLFKEHQIDEKMKQQKKFEDDLKFTRDVQSSINIIQNKIEEVVNESINRLENISIPIESIDNKVEILEISQGIENAKKIYAQILDSINVLTGEDGKDSIFTKNLNKLIIKQVSLKEQFDEIRRQIKIETLSIDDYPRIAREIVDHEKVILSLTEQISEEETIRTTLKLQLEELRKNRLNERNFYNKTVSNINDKKLSVSISLKSDGDKERFSSELEKYIQGSQIRKAKIDNIANSFDDTIEMYYDLIGPIMDSKIYNIFPMEEHFFRFKDKFLKSLDKLLTFKVPYDFELSYQGFPLQKHSDGQRASAIILFTLNIGKYDLLIVDQPEDDLNSGDIYKEIVTNMMTKKHKSQFLFSTHDPNITVLGDSEQVICFEYFDDSMNFTSGSIDSESSRKNVIKVMEGGEDAFNERNKIYSNWNL